MRQGLHASPLSSDSDWTLVITRVKSSTRDLLVNRKSIGLPLLIGCENARQLLYNIKNADNMTQIQFVQIKNVLAICGQFTHLLLL